MIGKLTILVLARNELKMTQLCLQSIRLFIGIDNYEVVLIDNHSEDETYEWACAQEGITVVSFDDEVKSWGFALNEVIRELEIDTDFLVMPAWCALTSGCVSGMMESMSESSVVGCICNHSDGVYYRPLREIADYRDALNYAEEIKSNDDCEVAMRLAATPILFKRDVYDKVGPFCEKIYALGTVYLDYSLRLLQKDIRIVVNRSCFSYAMDSEVGKDEYYKDDVEFLRNSYNTHYFNLAPSTFISALVEDDVRKKKQEKIRILEIGCDMGATLFDLKQKINGAEVYGCELNEVAAHIAENFAEVYVGNIEEHNLPFEKNYFDYIIFGDVLEHLRNPLDVLKYVKEYLRNGGKVVASIPNLMNITVIKELLKGNFTYTDMGLLVRTHIHLFTYNEINRMFAEAGYSKVSVQYNCTGLTPEDEELINKLIEIEPAAEHFMYKAFQYQVIASEE